MLRKNPLAGALATAAAILFGAASLSAAPVKLARHPDFNAGRITFSYLGDIWTANEDGGGIHR
jgi:tricorn protease